MKSIALVLLILGGMTIAHGFEKGCRYRGCDRRDLSLRTGQRVLPPWSNTSVNESSAQKDTQLSTESCSVVTGLGRRTPLSFKEFLTAQERNFLPLMS